jgi:hypothetical protein
MMKNDRCLEQKKFGQVGEVVQAPIVMRPPFIASSCEKVQDETYHIHSFRMNDRRRINPPSGGTAPPVFASTLSSAEQLQSQRPSRTRKSDELRKICMSHVYTFIPGPNS